VTAIQVNEARLSGVHIVVRRRPVAEPQRSYTENEPSGPPEGVKTYDITERLPVHQITNVGFVDLDERLRLRRIWLCCDEPLCTHPENWDDDEDDEWDD